MKQYQSSDWDIFRKEVIELDGGACVKCKRTLKDGVVLQVHHKEYIKGNLPWEYPYNSCETLCKGCHAAKHGIIPPKSGWEYAGSYDLEDLIGTCELCGSSIRYVFYVSHSSWPTLEVGTVCCDSLTGTETASTVRRKEERKLKFSNSPRWKEEKGILKIKQKKVEVEISPADSGFYLILNSVKGKTLYSSIDEAKNKVFEFIDSGQADEYFGKKTKLIKN